MKNKKNKKMINMMKTKKNHNNKKNINPMITQNKDNMNKHNMKKKKKR